MDFVLFFLPLVIVGIIAVIGLKTRWLDHDIAIPTAGKRGTTTQKLYLIAMIIVFIVLAVTLLSSSGDMPLTKSLLLILGIVIALFVFRFTKKRE